VLVLAAPAPDVLVLAAPAPGPNRRRDRPGLSRLDL